MTNRQTRKRLATRQRISDLASQMFCERGFDKVTVDEVAEAADVSRMTVFNHFPRKEDLFFDLDEGAREELLAAVRDRPAATSPVEAVRLFAHWAMASERPYVRIFEGGSDRFMSTVAASEALKARARAIRDELSDVLAETLARAVGGAEPDQAARLGASMLVASWAVALGEARREFLRTGDVGAAEAEFLAVVDRGAAGVEAALQGTAYVAAESQVAG